MTALRFKAAQVVGRRRRARAAQLPGVYIEEIPSGVRTIVGVARSITAFIGRARQGPVNGPTDLCSFDALERVFGGLWAPSALGCAVRDFFLNGGRHAIVVRLHQGADAATITAGGHSP